MDITPEKLKKLLVSPGHIKAKVFDAAKKEAQEKGQDLADVLVEKDLIRDDQLGQVIAQDKGYKFIDLSKEQIDEGVLALIPELVARSRKVIAFNQTNDGVKVGMVDPEDWEIMHQIEKRAGHPVIPYYITPRDLENALASYKLNLHEAFEKLLAQLHDESLTREQQDELTIQMVNTLLQYGYYNQASDIHIEPYRQQMIVRFRIDGIMHRVLDIPKELNEPIIRRIKILSRIRIDEHRAAQDGKLRFETDSGIADVRVSILPVTEGENVVLRLLSAKSRQFGLKDLGLSDENLMRLQAAIKHPHGMILTTGPSGSGKTTTLYAVLKILNRPEVHVATIEDPVEYDIEGVSQIQVDKKTNLTFAQGLRSLVRQDPDVIMVGEIRDEETADIAVNSAMTGHLVLSTLHTNDAPTTLPRLLDMKIEPFLVASTINTILAQRLVRRICERCRASYLLSAREKKMIRANPELNKLLADRIANQGPDKLDKIRLYRGSGCKVCGDTGFSGRVGIFEVLEMEDNIRDLVIKHSTSDQVREIARKNGMRTMFEDGVKKVLAGITTLEEVLRVTRE